MKNIQRKISCVLAVMLLFSFVGCKKSQENVSKNPVEIEKKEDLEGTTHEDDVKQTEYSFISNGRTDYKLLLPKESADIGVAVSEFTSFFKEATGIELQTETDEGKTYNADQKYISFGDTTCLRGSGIEANYSELGPQGFGIKTVGKSIFVYGQSKGVLYGAYELLRKLFDYETYTNKVYYIEKNVTEMNLPDITSKEIPDVLYRIGPDGPVFNDVVTRRRMGLMHDGELFPSQGKAHNMLETIVPMTSENLANHPDWFSNDHYQLCYTAHGNAAEYELMVDQAVESCKGIILSDTVHDSISLTQMDINVWCGCPTCTALKNKYGTDAVSQIYFVNDVSSRVQKWLDEEKSERQIQFVTFAYHKSEAAPAKKNADGTWSPIDDTVILNDNVSIWVAPISANYVESVHDPINTSMKQAMEGWRVCASSYFCWFYNTYYNNYLIPFDSYDGMQDLIKYAVSLNAKMIWPQGKYNTNQNTGFEDLKDYLYAKLMWNANRDINALIDDFFHKVYREASPEMEEAFWAYRMQSKIQKEEGRDGTCWTNLKTTKYWSKGYFLNQLERMENAKTKIEKYKTTDPTLYKAIYDSIVCETVGPRFLLCELYAGTYDTLELKNLKSAFKTDVERLDFTRLSEGSSITELIKNY